MKSWADWLWIGGETTVDTDLDSNLHKDTLLYVDPEFSEKIWNWENGFRVEENHTCNITCPQAKQLSIMKTEKYHYGDIVTNCITHQIGSLAQPGFHKRKKKILAMKRENETSPGRNKLRNSLACVWRLQTNKTSDDFQENRRVSLSFVYDEINGLKCSRKKTFNTD